MSEKAPPYKPDMEHHAFDPPPQAMGLDSPQPAPTAGGPSAPLSPLQVLTAAVTEAAPMIGNEERTRLILAKYQPQLVRAVRQVTGLLMDARDQAWLAAVDVAMPAHYREKLVIPPRGN